jgi:hypothetical protein
MKCIKPSERSLKNGGNPREVIRVSDEKAAKAVEKGHYVYCPKSEWKEAGRHHS